MGSEVISEVNQQGSKIKSYVKAAGATLATQNVNYDNSQQVNFEHWDSSGMSRRTTNSSGAEYGWTGMDFSPAELDPLGNNAGVETPYTQEPEPQPPVGEGGGSGVDGIQPFRLFDEEPLMVNGQRVSCTLDGIEAPCSMAMSGLASGATQVVGGDQYVLRQLGIFRVWRPDSGRTAPTDTSSGSSSEDDVIRINSPGDGGTWEYFFSSSWDARWQQTDPYGRIPLVQKLRSKTKLSQKDCDIYLARILGDGTSLVATKNEPLGVGQNRQFKIVPGSDREHHLGKNGTLHMYANPDGSARDSSNGKGKMYIPDGGTLVNPTAGTFPENYYDKRLKRKVYTGEYSNEFIFNYRGGLSIEVFHVGGTTGTYAHNGKTIGHNVIQPDETDRNEFGYRIGYIGGLGGADSIDYVHSHWQFRVNGELTDPRKLFCGW